MKLKLILITPERNVSKEICAINHLFENGLETLHFRKPLASIKETERMISEIDSSFHRRIVIHDHFQLMEKFGLKGIHLNRRNPGKYPEPGISVSISCHSLEEIKNARGYDYLFLSPVFDSISKTGYRKGFTHVELTDACRDGIITNQTIALGGITAENIPGICQYGFGGVAVLGTVWNEFETDADINRLQQKMNALNIICDAL